MDVGDHAKSTDLKPMRSPMRLKGSAPIRCCIKQTRRTGGIYAQGVLCAGTKGAIDRGFEVDQIVYVDITADAADGSGKAAVDDRGGWSESRPERRCGVGESPGGRGVPRVLDSWIVVCRNSIGNVHLAESRRVRKANIGVVPAPGMNKWVDADTRCWGLLAIGHLRKSSDMIGDCSTPKEA